MDIIKDIRPLTEFKRETAKFTNRLRETGKPAFLTVNGKASLVVMDANAWQDMQNRLEYADSVAGIRKGLAQIRNDEGLDADAFFDTLDATAK
ncbi:MAG: type II toxin-antitoxin system Phd/YefM family antitoxin [Thalassospira sp.]|uniref:type II toxin-antitoxin system Phd/YefM family antitoxin n=1 Tax=Thalassospira sp. TaxID=1912094 RepID=UPI0032EC736E